MPPGTYTIRFSLPGFNTVRRRGVQMAGGVRVTVDEVLAPLVEPFPHPAPPFGIDPDRRCLHGSQETVAERRRRELAIRIRWGTNEPLPGWGIAWVTSQTRSRFAVIDLRDPCGFTYSSEDPEVLQSYRVVPLTS